MTHNLLSRRDALKLPLLGALSGWADENAAKARVTIHAERPGAAIPADFLGFSMEKSVLAEPFPAGQHGVAESVPEPGRRCAAAVRGARRDTYWSRTEVNPAANKGKRKTIGPMALDNLYAFAKEAVGAFCTASIWEHTTRPWLQTSGLCGEGRRRDRAGVEIGNEPDIYTEHEVRPANYGYTAYRGEIEAYQRAILERVPHAPLAGPATTKSSDWFPRSVSDFKDRLTLATSHLYPLSAKVKDARASRFASVPNLLDARTDQVWMPMIEAHQKAASAAGLPFRLGECNSASGGGTDGVSDVFASALWGADFLFDMASRGLAGINFHGYFYDRGYTPFCLRRPLCAASDLLQSAAVPPGCPRPYRARGVRDDGQGLAHATLGDDRKLRVVLINKDPGHAAVVSVAHGSERRKGQAIRLTAPSVTSKEGVTLTRNAVNRDGTWTPLAGASEPVQSLKGTFDVPLPAASVALLTIE